MKRPVKKVTSPKRTFLIIVESPSKCKKIEEYLGSQYQCIASKGHLRELKTIPSDLEDIRFSNIPEKESHIDWMRTVIQSYPPSHVILATDDDREGEAIAWHICDLFQLPVSTTRRIVFHEITKPALLKSMDHPGTINMHTVHSQKARQVLDITVGFKISPYLWKYIYSSKKNALSAGRCQTASLRLVYDNYREREKKGCFPDLSYKTVATFFPPNMSFVLNHDFVDKESATAFLHLSTSFPYKLHLGEPKESIQSPPKPFNTSRLLQTASNVLSISPKQTMMYCQKLYQEGHITYMRTDSQKYSREFLTKGKEFIEEKWGVPFVGSLETLENNDHQNPHEAIRVTHLECSSLTGSTALEPHLQSVYKLIWKNTVESCMSEAKTRVTVASMVAPLNYTYLRQIEIPLFLGWKACKTPGATTQEQMDGVGEIFYLETLVQSGSPFTHTKIESTVHWKRKHSYYTEASLIQKLEDLGIGRPSTFSYLVETIQERGYVKKKSIEGEWLDAIDLVLKESVLHEMATKKKWGNENNKLVIEPMGILAIEFLIRYFNELFSYEYTQKMEQTLDEGETPFDICHRCSHLIGELTQEMKKIEKQTFLVEDYELVFQRLGPVLRRKNAEGKTEYKSVKKDIQIDLEKLRKNEYSLEDLMEIQNEHLGTYKEIPVLLKTGPFGPYVEWGEEKKSMKTVDKPLNEITLEDAIPFFEPLPTVAETERKPPASLSSIIREVSDEISIRKGKFGPYIYHQTKHMNKPQFFPIKGLKVFETMSLEELRKWIQDKYHI